MFCIIILTGVNKTTSYDELKEIGDSVVENVQTGQLARQLNTEIVSLDITDPIPEPVDPTGGVRATNETCKFLIMPSPYRSFSKAQCLISASFGRCLGCTLSQPKERF